MSSCSFEKLLKLVEKKLDLDGQIELYDHLDRCDNCRETVYQILRDRDSELFVTRRADRRREDLERAAAS